MDHELWINYTNIVLESKILNNLKDKETHSIHFRKGSPFNETLHDILKRLISLGFKAGFLMELLKDLEMRYVFDSVILAEFRVSFFFLI